MSVEYGAAVQRRTTHTRPTDVVGFMYPCAVPCAGKPTEQVFHVRGAGGSGCVPGFDGGGSATPAAAGGVEDSSSSNASSRSNCDGQLSEVPPPEQPPALLSKAQPSAVNDHSEEGAVA